MILTVLAHKRPRLDASDRHEMRRVGVQIPCFLPTP
jgi:hypothetical protein